MPRRSSTTVKVFYPPWTREELVTRLRERVRDLHGVLPLRRVVLFGSYATGRHTVASDVDLLVVYVDPAREDAYGIVRQALGIQRLEPQVYAETEWEAVKPTVERMIRDGISIYESP